MSRARIARPRSDPPRPPRRTACRAHGLVALLLAAALVACSLGPESAEGERWVVIPGIGCTFQRPALWTHFLEEVRSPAGSVLSVQTESLVEGDPRFLAGLPDTLIPQLEEWARYFYQVVEAPTRREIDLGGAPAMELRYRIRVRTADPPSSVTYWVARRGDQVFILRLVHPPRAEEADAAAVQEILTTWRFIDEVVG